MAVADTNINDALENGGESPYIHIYLSGKSL